MQPKQKFPPITDSTGEEWTPGAAGIVCALFLILLIIGAIASLVARVMH